MRIRHRERVRQRMSTEEHFEFAPIRTYQQVADEMTRRGHAIPVNSIGFYERSGFAKIRAEIEKEGWI